jgi:signal transduction histidine kinase
MAAKLLVVLLLPAIASVVLGGLRINSALAEAKQYNRVHQLADVADSASDLVQYLQTERDLTSRYIAEGRASLDPDISNVQADVDSASAAFTRLATPIADGSGTAAATVSARALGTLKGLPTLRDVALHSQLPASATASRYTDLISSLLALEPIIADGITDFELVRDSRGVLDSLSGAKEFASQERGQLAIVLAEGRFNENGDEFLDFLRTDSELRLAIDQFEAAASPIQVQRFNDTVSGAKVDNAEGLTAAALLQAGAPKIGNIPADTWFAAISDRVDRTRLVEQSVVAEISDRSQLLRDDSRRSAILDSALVGGVLVLALLVSLLVGQSMVRPLQVLRAFALETAHVRLPAIIERMRSTDLDDARLEADAEERVPIASHEEIGQVARAFEQVRSEAVRLAGEQAALRGNVNAMFVNLSRRSQSLVERQLQLIDELEGAERDPDQLAALFTLDHLATRMRRNSENLLVLAGEDAGRRWGQPVPLLDVLRAATSEVDQYRRVQLASVPDVEVLGNTVNHLVHLIAELLENATVFSPPETKVMVHSQHLSDGGAMIEIEDRGIGMNPTDIAEANERLVRPPVFEVGISRMMGLYVVGRLATRHGILVQLRPSEQGGVTAFVRLPADVLADENSPAVVTSTELPSAETGDRPGGFRSALAGGLPRRSIAGTLPPGEHGPNGGYDGPGGAGTAFGPAGSPGGADGPARYGSFGGALPAGDPAGTGAPVGHSGGPGGPGGSGGPGGPGGAGGRGGLDGRGGPGAGGMSGPGAGGFGSGPGGSAGSGAGGPGGRPDGPSGLTGPGGLPRRGAPGGPGPGESGGPGGPGRGAPSGPGGGAPWSSPASDLPAAGRDNPPVTPNGAGPLPRRAPGGTPGPASFPPPPAPGSTSAGNPGGSSDGFGPGFTLSDADLPRPRPGQPSPSSWFRARAAEEFGAAGGAPDEAPGSRIGPSWTTSGRSGAPGQQDEPGQRGPAAAGAYGNAAPGSPYGTGGPGDAGPGNGGPGPYGTGGPGSPYGNGGPGNAGPGPYGTGGPGDAGSGNGGPGPYGTGGPGSPYGNGGPGNAGPGNGGPGPYGTGGPGSPYGNGGPGNAGSGPYGTGSSGDAGPGNGAPGPHGTGGPGDAGPGRGGPGPYGNGGPGNAGAGNGGPGSPYGNGGPGNAGAGSGGSGPYGTGGPGSGGPDDGSPAGRAGGYAPAGTGGPVNPPYGGAGGNGGPGNGAHDSGGPGGFGPPGGYAAPNPGGFGAPGNGGTPGPYPSGGNGGERGPGGPGGQVNFGQPAKPGQPAGKGWRDGADMAPSYDWQPTAADAGWAAAERLHSPSTGGTTSAGLPMRVPQAHLMPGTARDDERAPHPPAGFRSADQVRGRLSSYQQGVRRGRSADSTGEPQ